HAGGHAEVEAYAVGVPRPRPGAGAEDHLVASKVGDDFLDQREDRRPAAVDEALAADLDDVGVRQDVDQRGSIRSREQLLVVERALHEGVPQLGQEVVYAVSLFHLPAFSSRDAPTFTECDGGPRLRERTPPAIPGRRRDRRRSPPPRSPARAAPLPARLEAGECRPSLPWRASSRSTGAARAARSSAPPRSSAARWRRARGRRRGGAGRRRSAP